MRKSRLSRVVSMMITFCAVMTITSSAQILNTLLSFDGSNGEHPDSSLIHATDGNFYGVTQNGGMTNQNCTSGGCGTVFRITPGGLLNTLYQFCSLGNCADGANPYGYLVQGTDGNFYGTTIYGGANLNGTVFKITPSGHTDHAAQLRLVYGRGLPLGRTGASHRRKFLRHNYCGWYSCYGHCVQNYSRRCAEQPI